MSTMIEVTTAQLHKYLVGAVTNQMNTLVVGSPGIGKSDIVEAVARDTKHDLVIFHPVTSDPVDFKGLPYVENGKASYLLDDHLRKLTDAKKKTICFFDDLGQAPAGVQAACMQILQARRINSHAISDKVTFIAATNRRSDGSGVNGILEALKSRFRPILQLEPDIDSWCDWALNNNMPAELIAFMRFKPNLLNDPKPSKEMVNFPCPRTIAAVGKWVNAGFVDAPVIAGCVGDGFATEFLSFLKVWGKLPAFTQIVLNPDTTPVPDMSEPSVMYAISGMLAKNASDSNLEAVCRYASRLPVEFNVLMMKDAIKQHPEIVSTKAFIDWSIKHNNVL